MRFGIAKAGSLLVAGVALTSAIGFSAAGTASATVAPGATVSCGGSCTDITSRVLGAGGLLNAYVPGDTGTGSKPGQLININQAANNHPNQDFQIEPIGTVASQCRSIVNPDGVLLSNSVLCIPGNGFLTHTAYEFDYAPFGNQTGLCTGTTGTPYNGMQVRLTSCGTTEGTLIVQGPDVTAGGATYNTYLSGATNTFSHPYVLSVNTSSSAPGNLIQLQQENTSGAGVVNSNQLFALTTGPFS